MSSTRTFRIDNTGDVAADITSISITPDDVGFSVGTSVSLPYHLLAGESLDVPLIATAVSFGTAVATLSVVSSGEPSPAEFTLSATLYGPLAPNEVSGLQCWWDASQITGLSNGEDVVTWVDLSGRNIGMSSSLASRRPVYLTGIQNGLPAVRFDKGNLDSLWSQGGEGVGTFALTQQCVFFVARVNTLTLSSPGPAMGLFTSSQSTADSFHGIQDSASIVVSDYGTGALFFKDGVNTPSGDLGTLSPHIYEMRRDSPVVNTGGIRFYMAIANEANQGGAQSLDIYEAFIYSSNPTAEQHNGIMLYLSQKWGISYTP